MIEGGSSGKWTEARPLNAMRSTVRNLGFILGND